ncbi:bZIP transcription factor (AtfA) [Phytophthora palmivora]|uniref:BZIP transcription factor (AtfA) n=2 Tax=Phytophthora palmivora TaxID=4796 RepID=A0A2P4YU84_9STRA|nr:bZIP transcription factor (AtfA) [Phytophthora palmivora]
MHSPGRFRAASRRRWDPDDDEGDAFLSASDLVRTLQPVPRHPSQSRRAMAGREPPRRWPPPMETQPFDWPFDQDARKAGAYGEQHAMESGDYRARAYYDEPRHSQAQLQRYHQQRQYEAEDEASSQQYRRVSDIYAREMRGRETLDDVPFDPPRRIPRTGATSPFGVRPRDARVGSRRYSPGLGARMDDLPLEPAMLDMYPGEVDTARREYGQPARQRSHQMPRRHATERLNDAMTDRRPFHDPDLPRDRRGGESRAVYEELVPTATAISQNNDYGNLSPGGAGASDIMADLSSSRQRLTQLVARQHKTKRPRLDEHLTSATLTSATKERALEDKPSKPTAVNKSVATPVSTSSDGKESESQPKRRCGRKSMNYSSEQKRERNRAAVKKCRQRQALKLDYLQHKAEALAAENQTLSEMLMKNTELDEEQRSSLTRGIQMDILLKIKEIFTQSLPKDFVLDADSIWDLNSVLAVSMPSRCYYGIESIKDFWRTSLRMRNKGKIRSFWAWLFRLPPGDRFSEFEIQPFSPASNLYFISWTTKSTPPLAGSMVIMFGNGHRVTLHVECFGWLIWRYLLTNEPFPEPTME